MTAPRPLAYWTSTISRLIDEQAEDGIAAAGLERSQWRVLDRLASGAVEESRAGELLAPYAGVDSVDEVLRSLVMAGLAEQRNQDFRLTAHGEERAAELRAGPVEAVSERAVADLEQDELDALLAGLERVARNLGWLEQG